MPTAGLNVAIYNNGNMFKHWSLFVDGPSEEKFLFHIMGSSTRYRYEKRQSDARASASLSEIVALCKIDTSKISAIEAAAQNAVIHNESAGYNCQDYVLELLEALENDHVIDSRDANYQKKKRTLASKVDGFA
nr:hypothetical protein CFP56_09477 [Quercus suber]